MQEPTVFRLFSHSDCCCFFGGKLNIFLVNSISIIHIFYIKGIKTQKSVLLLSQYVSTPFGLDLLTCACLKEAVRDV